MAYDRHDRPPRDPRARQDHRYAEGPLARRLTSAFAGAAVVVVLAIGVFLLFGDRADDDSVTSEAGVTSVDTAPAAPANVADNEVAPTSSVVDTTETAATAITGPYVQAQLEADSFVLSGVVPSAELAASYLQAAEIAYFPFVRSELMVDAGVGPADWLASGPQALAMLPLITDATLVIADEGVELSGRSPTEERLGRLEGALGQITGLPVTVGEVEITNLADPTYIMAGNGGQIVLSGRLPSEEIRTGLVEAAADAYGEGSVTDQITVDPGVFTSFWMYSGGPLMQAMSVFPDYEMRIDGTAFSGYINGGVTFEPNSAEFSGSYAQVLDVGVGVLTRDQSLQLVIEGHTDDQGPADANLELSQLRAEAVMNYFVENGIDPGRLTAIGYGETEPVVPNDSAEGRARNRRIQYVLTSAQ